LGNPEMMFLRSPEGIGKALRQGEILANVVELQIEPKSIRLDDLDSVYDVNPVLHPFAIVLSQDCDLEQDFNFRYNAKGNMRHELPSILFCQAEDADKFAESERYKGLFSGSKFPDDFTRNNEFRYHFIQNVPLEFDRENCGLPNLGMDFKRYFTMPTAEVYQRVRLAHTQRRTQLQSPYLEHFCDRFHNFNNRIALPEEYEST